MSVNEITKLAVSVLAFQYFILFTGTGVMNSFALRDFHKRKKVWMKVQLLLVRVYLFKSFHLNQW